MMTAPVKAKRMGHPHAPATILPSRRAATRAGARSARLARMSRTREPLRQANGPSSVQWLLAQRKRLQERTRLVERQTRESRVQRGWIPVPKVAEEIRLDVPSGKNSCSQPKQGLPAAKNSSSTLA